MLYKFVIRKFQTNMARRKDDHLSDIISLVQGSPRKKAESKLKAEPAKETKKRDEKKQEGSLYPHKVAAAKSLSLGSLELRRHGLGKWPKRSILHFPNLFVSHLLVKTKIRIVDQFQGDTSATKQPLNSSLHSSSAGASGLIFQ